MPDTPAPELPPLIGTFVGAMHRGDVAAMLACLAPDIHLTRIDDGQVTAEARGLSAVAALIGHEMQAPTRRGWELREIRSAGKTTLIEIAVVEHPGPGIERRSRGAVSFRLRPDGLIQRLVEEV